MHPSNRRSQTCHRVKHYLVIYGCNALTLQPPSADEAAATVIAAVAEFCSQASTAVKAAVDVLGDWQRENLEIAAKNNHGLLYARKLAVVYRQIERVLNTSILEELLLGWHQTKAGGQEWRAAMTAFSEAQTGRPLKISVFGIKVLIRRTTTGTAVVFPWNISTPPGQSQVAKQLRRRLIKIAKRFSTMHGAKSEEEAAKDLADACQAFHEQWCERFERHPIRVASGWLMLLAEALRNMHRGFQDAARNSYQLPAEITRVSRKVATKNALAEALLNQVSDMDAVSAYLNTLPGDREASNFLRDYLRKYGRSTYDSYADDRAIPTDMGNEFEYDEGWHDHRRLRDREYDEDRGRLGPVFAWACVRFCGTMCHDWLLSGRLSEYLAGELQLDRASRQRLQTLKELVDAGTPLRDQDRMERLFDTAAAAVHAEGRTEPDKSFVTQTMVDMAKEKGVTPNAMRNRVRELFKHLLDQGYLWHDKRGRLRGEDDDGFDAT